MGCKGLLDDLRETRGYCKLKEEALDHSLWRTADLLQCTRRDDDGDNNDALSNKHNDSIFRKGGHLDDQTLISTLIIPRGRLQ